MESTLRRYGLSETRHQLKLLTPRMKAESNQPSQDIFMRMMQILRRKSEEKCLQQGHQENSVRYICLQKNCPQQVGCSHCFLLLHKGHLKTEMKTCMRDIQRIHSKKQSYLAQTADYVRKIKSDLMGRIDEEIKSVKLEFEASLDYISKKVKSDINRIFAPYPTSYPTSYRTSYPAHSLCENTATTITDSLLGMDKIIDQLKNSSRTLRKTVEPMDDQELLMRVRRLDIGEIEQSLENGVAGLTELERGLDIYERYFSQMTSSLAEFFVHFKRHIPQPPPPPPQQLSKQGQ